MQSAAKGFCLIKDYDTRLFRLVFRFDMDRNARALKGILQDPLDPVINFMRLKHRRCPRHHKMKVDEDYRPCVACPKVVGLYCTVCLRRDISRILFSL